MQQKNISVNIVNGTNQLQLDLANAADFIYSIYGQLMQLTCQVVYSQCQCYPERKIHHSLPLHKHSQNLTNTDVTKETLNCTATFLADDSIGDATSFIRRIVLWSENELNSLSDHRTRSCPVPKSESSSGRIPLQLQPLLALNGRDQFNSYRAAASSRHHLQCIGDSGILTTLLADCTLRRQLSLHIPVKSRNTIRLLLLVQYTCHIYALNSSMHSNRVYTNIHAATRYNDHESLDGLLDFSASSAFFCSSCLLTFCLVLCAVD